VLPYIGAQGELISTNQADEKGFHGGKVKARGPARQKNLAGLMRFVYNIRLFGVSLRPLQNVY
jgi:hypothetical protein